MPPVRQNASVLLTTKSDKVTNRERPAVTGIVRKQIRRWGAIRPLRYPTSTTTSSSSSMETG
eukprot:3539460-Rhodomonas_salina.4